MGIVGGGEASAAVQPATGGRSRRHDRRCFGRLEQEDQRLKKHYGRWMDILRSLELESFILTKLTKPAVPVNLVGPQVSLPPRWVPASRGSIHFFVQNKEALPMGPSWQRGECFFHEIRWPIRWVRAVREETFFSEIRWPVRWVPTVRWRNNYFARNKEALPCSRLDPAVSLSTYNTLLMEVGR